LEREKKRRREIKGKEENKQGISSKVE